MKQNKLLHVMPECFVDTNLIEYLLNAGVNHQHCCSKVVGQLKSTFADYTSAVRKNVYFCPWLLRVCGERKITKKD